MTSPAPAPSRPRDPFRAVAAGICALEALSLVVFAVVILGELAGGSDDAVRVVMSALVILVFAVGVTVLARGWLRGDNWPNTPTVVWNALLLPVGWSVLQGDLKLGALLVVVALVGIVAAVRANTTDADSTDADSAGD